MVEFSKKNERKEGREERERGERERERERERDLVLEQFL